MLEQMDALIAHRRTELRSLEVARDALTSWLSGGGLSVPATPAPALAAPPKPRTADLSERREQIRKRSAPAPEPTTSARKYQRRTASFKLKVLEEVDGGRPAGELAAEHGMSVSNVALWRRQRAEGRLVAEAEEGADDAPAKAPAFYEDSMESAPKAEEDEGDLVDAFDGPKEVAAEDPGPFGEEDGMPTGFAGPAPRSNGRRPHPGW